MHTAYIHWNIAPEAFTVFGIPVRYYGLLFVGGFIAGYHLMEWMYKREHISLRKLNQLATYIIIGAFAGARLGHCLFYEPDYFLFHPLEMFFPIGYSDDGSIVFKAYSGLASHGGAFGVLLSIVIYKWRTGEKIISILDHMAIATPLAGFFIRMANFFNSEIIGYHTNVPWAIVFEQVDDQPRHPAQLYEALFYLALFIFLFFWYKRHGISLSPGVASGEVRLLSDEKSENNESKTVTLSVVEGSSNKESTTVTSSVVEKTETKTPSPGFYFACSFIMIFSFRFFVEFIKERQVDFEYQLPIDMGQLLSIPMVLMGVAVYFYGKRIQNKNSAI